MSDVFLSAWRRLAKTSGQRALPLRVLWAPSVMLSPKATIAELLPLARTLTPLRKGQLMIWVGASSFTAVVTLPGAV